jgi:hypothetical protein
MKIWKNCNWQVWNKWNHDVIPVVLSRRVMRAHMPDDGFIAVDDYVDVLAMTQHLRYLDRNITAYLKCV